MANYNVFNCEAGNFNITDAIAGQTPLAWYDSIKQAALTPEIRTGSDGKGLVIMPYERQTAETLFSQWSAVVGSDKRTVKSREFNWFEYDQYDSNAFVVNKSNSSVPAPGASVTVTIDTLSKSSVGFYSKPIAGYYAYIKELNQQKVFITTVTTGGSSAVTITPINGQVLNLTQYGRYTIVTDPLKHSDVAAIGVRSTKGKVLNPPVQYKSYVQQFEDGIGLHQDEISNYVYDRDFKIIKGLDTNGKAVEFFYLPYLNDTLEASVQDSMNHNTVWGQRDVLQAKGFDGMLPTIRKYGAFNSNYDIFTSTSLKAIIQGMVKTLHRTNGSSEYMLLHDFLFAQDWSEQIADLIKAANQSYRYELFGRGGEGVRNFDYYSFEGFTYFGYKFTPYQMNILDSSRYGNMIEYFSIMMPLKKFKDHTGAEVPVATYCYLQGAEPAKYNNMWIDDTTKRDGYLINAYVQTAYGLEIHAPTRLGLLQKSSLQ